MHDIDQTQTYMEAGADAFGETGGDFMGEGKLLGPQLFLRSRRCDMHADAIARHLDPPQLRSCFGATPRSLRQAASMRFLGTGSDRARARQGAWHFYFGGQPHASPGRMGSVTVPAGFFEV
jgi:hypothetical protein